MKLSDFIQQEQISLTYRASDRNPHMEDSDNMDNWRVTLRAGRSRMSLYYSKGVGLHGAPPTVDEVLDCLASDAAGFENASGFADWAGDYGYDTDSRKAERIFKTIQDQAARLNNLLGDSAYKTLLWETERS